MDFQNTPSSLQKTLPNPTLTWYLFVSRPSTNSVLVTRSCPGDSRSLTSLILRTVLPSLINSVVTSKIKGKSALVSVTANWNAISYSSALIVCDCALELMKKWRIAKIVNTIFVIFDLMRSKLYHEASYDSLAMPERSVRLRIQCWTSESWMV